MSVCDPNSPDACDKCKCDDRAWSGHPSTDPRMSDCDLPGCQHLNIPPLEAELTDEQRADLEDMETRLKALRLEARGLVRSGNPEVKAEGKAGLAYIEDQLAWVRGKLSKDA